MRRPPLFTRLKYWWFRRQNNLPHPEELNPFLVKQDYLRELAKLYRSGFNLEQCATIIKCMSPPPRDPPLEEGKIKTPARNFHARMFFGREHTRERLRQLLWKIWRDQRVVRYSR